MKRILLAFFLACATLSSAALPGPTSASFAKGAMFTVAGYTGASTLAGFPVLVRIAKNSPSGFSYDDLLSKATGADIAFVDMAGNGLPFEIDTWNPNGTSLIWVRLPSMQNGTQFVMCWGSATSGKTVCGTNPWSDYTGVWHMGEETAGITTIHDSTANALDGTSVATSSSKTDGQVGRARFITSNTENKNGKPYDSGITVDMTDDAAKLAAVDAIVPEFSASFWVRPQNNAQWWYFITRKAADPNPGWGLQNGSDGNNSSFKVFRAYGGSENDQQCMNLTGVNGLAKETWTKIDAVWMSDKTFKLYVNGVFAKEGTLANAAQNGNQTKLGIGGSMAPPPLDQNLNDNHKNGRGVYGDMDEVRLRAGVLSEDWIAADYATQNSASFLTAGAAESYVASAEPQVGVTVSDVSFTGATFVTSVGSLGMDAGMATDASWVDLLLLVGTDPALSSPLFSVPLDRVSAAPSSVSKSLSDLSPNTTYYAQVRATNSLAVAGESIVAPFATPNPAPAFTASVSTDHLSPEIALAFTDIGWGSAVTRISVLVSTAADFSSTALSKAFPVNLATMPTNVSDIVLTALPAASPLYYRFTAENTGGYSRAVEVSASSSTILSAGDNVWSGLSENIDDPNAYVFAGGLPAPDKTLYFTTPAGLSPVIDRDVVMPSLRFWSGKTDQNSREMADTAYLDGFHSCGYDLAGSGVLTFSAEKPIVQASKGTNVVRNPILFNRSNGQTVYVTARNGRLDLAGKLMLPQGVTNTTMRATGAWSDGGEIHFGGPSPDFMGRLHLELNLTLSLDHPGAMTNASRIFFGDGWGTYSYLKNNTGGTMTFPRCTMMDDNRGTHNSTRVNYTGAPFGFPVGTLVWAPRDWGGSTIDADVSVKNLTVAKNKSNTSAGFEKNGNGALIVTGTTAWSDDDCVHDIRLRRGCFWPMTAAGLPPSGEFYIPNDYVWRSTLGLNADFNPMLDGSSTPRFFQTSKLASWGFTGFGGERTVCWNADPTLNLTNTTSVTVSIPLGDASHTNVAGKAYSDYYAYPARFMFGNRSEFADGTILFLNPIRYEFGQDWDAYTYFESTNHVVAARLRGSLKLGTGNKTWNFSGNSFGGYLALEADNPDFTGKVNVTEKGNLLVNSNLVARSVTVQSGAGLGGTGALSTGDGTTVKSGGALFGGEWNKDGTLALDGKVTLEGGSALRVEVGASNDRIGCVKLAAGSTLKLGSPVYVDVDTDPRVSPVRGTAVKILDWSEAAFDAGAAPTRADFVARPERNSDIETIYVFTRNDGLYVNYVSVRYPQPTLLILR